MPLVVVVVVVCFGKRVFPDLLTGLSPPVDFILVSVYGTVPHMRRLETESSFGVHSVSDPVWISTAKCDHLYLGCQ